MLKNSIYNKVSELILLSRRQRVLSLLAALLLFSAAEKVSAQSFFFFVAFDNKDETPYSLDRPEEFLSSRALERRSFFSVPIDSTDLPVNPHYIETIQNISPSLRVHATTKWLNGATLLVGDSSLMSEVRNLDFVRYSQFTGRNHASAIDPPMSGKLKNNLPANINYGSAQAQIEQVNGTELHRRGYTGENIQIAVIDAGFRTIDTNPAFKTMRDEGRIIEIKDFANPKSDLSNAHNHGTYVLSIMGAKQKKPAYTGTAPDASYLLLRSEAEPGEYLHEPDLWISAIEYADSVGVDIATTSLGYTTFDFPSMNYSHADLDGNTARASIAADIAFSKGILLFNAAGNEGNKTWKHISVPADAKNTITVGAVDDNGIRAPFSAYGPTADGRIKPELVATGLGTSLIYTDGQVFSSNGTSYSTPIVAGMSACLLQAAKELRPTFTLNELKEIIFKSASQYDTPDNYLGYGIPNFEFAYEQLLQSAANNIDDNTRKTGVSKLLIQPGMQSPVIYLPSGKNSAILRLYSAQGVLLLQKELLEYKNIIETRNLPGGVYILHID